MLLHDKPVDLNKLEDELIAAGILVHGLALIGDDLQAVQGDGTIVDLPPGAQAIINAHVSPPVIPMPDFGSDGTPLDQVAAAVQNLRAYIALGAPTQAQTVAVVKLLCRCALFLLKQGFPRASH